MPAMDWDVCWVVFKHIWFGACPFPPNREMELLSLLKAPFTAWWPLTPLPRQAYRHIWVYNSGLKDQEQRVYSFLCELRKKYSHPPSPTGVFFFHFANIYTKKILLAFAFNSFPFFLGYPCQYIEQLLRKLLVSKNTVIKSSLVSCL